MGKVDNQQLALLLEKLAEGDIAAMGDISIIMEKLLMAIGNIYYRNRADVEDAVHDLYVALLKKACYFRRKYNACAWIIAVYKNDIISDLRRKSREKLWTPEEFAQYYRRNEMYIENHLFLQDILAMMTEEEKDLVVYYYWCRCTLREIEKIVGIPRSTLHRRLQEIREKAEKFAKN